MKTYVVTTGVVFALIVLMYVWRAIVEGSHMATDPWFLLITTVAAALSLWAFRLVWVASRT